jgi:hypothetical protein
MLMLLLSAPVLLLDITHPQSQRVHLQPCSRQTLQQQQQQQQQQASSKKCKCCHLQMSERLC